MNRGAYWLRQAECRIEDFAKLVDRSTKPADVPLAAEIRANVPVYDCDAVRGWIGSPEKRRAVMAEWGEVMTRGAGLVVLGGAFSGAEELAAVDAVTAQFKALIAEQRASNKASGDHFAKPGANDRIWNALEKLCLRDPQAFAAYYANPIIALVSEAWLARPTRSPRRSMLSTRAAPHNRRTATTTSAFNRPRSRRVTRRMCIGCRRR